MQLQIPVAPNKQLQPEAWTMNYFKSKFKSLKTVGSGSSTNRAGAAEASKPDVAQSKQTRSYRVKTTPATPSVDTTTKIPVYFSYTHKKPKLTVNHI